MTDTLMTPNSDSAQLEKVAPGHYLVKGQLNFNSVPELWEDNKSLLFEDDATSLQINLSQIERSDSSGLALLVEWYREAEKRHKKIIFLDLPAQMYDIARISGLNEILPLAKK